MTNYAPEIYQQIDAILSREINRIKSPGRKRPGDERIGAEELARTINRELDLNPQISSDQAMSRLAIVRSRRKQAIRRPLPRTHYV